MIPKSIHSIYIPFEGNNHFPVLYNECIRQTKQMHPSWEMNLYNEIDIQRIMEKYLPDFIDAYNSFEYNVQRTDFMRFALIYIYGGFYMDLDVLMFKPLDELLGSNVVLAEEKTISEEEQCELNLKYRLRIANYMFGSIPNHPFWLLMMIEMANRANISIDTEQGILDITGPGLLTNCYLDNADKFPDIKLLRNTDKRCRVDSHKEIACHFGDYAAHLHSGAWRKQIRNKNVKD